MGWRSWDFFGADVNQSLMEQIMDGMARRERLVDGVPTSLCDLGYCDVGLDDGWQACGSHAGGALHYHDAATGRPLVNETRFPSLLNMTTRAHSLGLRAGWYGNNCICADHATGEKKFYAADVAAMRAFGFDSWKLDGCGAQTDLGLWDELLRESKAESGRQEILVENCHWGSVKPAAPTFNATGGLICPWNLYRTSGDVYAAYVSVFHNLQSVFPYADKGLSRPGCWAYPDMLEVGTAGGATGKGLSIVEQRTQFAAWAIVSSPLTLAMDLRNATVMDAVWPIVSNREVLAVNQAWAGHSGSLFASSKETVVLGASTVAPVWQQLYKPLPSGATAVLLINNADAPSDVELRFENVPGAGCTGTGCTFAVRDLHARRDLGEFRDGFSSKGLASHDARFLVIRPAVEAD